MLLKIFTSILDKLYTICLETNTKLVANVRVFHFKNPVPAEQKTNTAPVDRSNGAELKHTFRRGNSAKNPQIHVQRYLGRSYLLDASAQESVTAGNVLLYLMVHQNIDAFLFQKAFKIISIFMKIKLIQRFKS